MRTNYLVIEHNVIRTRRKLNILKGLRIGLTISGGLTLLYLIAFLFGWVEMVQPWLLVVFANALAAGAGIIWGDLQPIRLQQDLLRVDRALDLGEKLTTIYELRRSKEGPSDILEALYRRIGQSNVEVDQVFALSRRERNGWYAFSGVCAGILLVGSLMINGLNPLSLSEWLQSLPLSDSIKEQLAIGIEQQLGSKNSPLDPSAQLGDLEDQNKGERVCDENASAFGEECYGEESQNGSMNPDPQSRQGMPQNFPQSLSDLLDQLQQGAISPDQLREELRGLADQLSPGILKDMLENAVNTTDPQELAERLRDALREAQRQQENQKRRAESREEGGDSVGSNGGRNPDFPGSLGDQEYPEQNPSSSQNGNNGQGQSQSQPGSNDEESAAEEGGDQLEGGEGNESGQGASSQDGGDSLAGGGDGEGQKSDQDGESGESGGGENSNQSDEGGEGNSGNPEGDLSGQRSDGERSEGGGESPGDGPNDGREGSPSDPMAYDKSLLIQSGNLPKDIQILQKLVTLGLPVDLEGAEVNGSVNIKLNMERVESLLQLRELPPNLRALVRAYFLAIAGEKSK